MDLRSRMLIVRTKADIHLRPKYVEHVAPICLGSYKCLLPVDMSIEVLLRRLEVKRTLSRAVRFYQISGPKGHPSQGHHSSVTQHVVVQD